MSSPRGRSRIEQLVRATPMLISELDLQRVLANVAELSRNLLRAQYAAVGLLGPDNRTLESFTTAGLTDEQRARIGHLPIGRGILGLVIREGEVIRLKDLSKHPASVGFPAHHPPMNSFLGVPIIGRHRLIGDLYLTEKIGEPEFSEEDAELAQLLASIVASAVENARSYEQASHLLDEVQQLHRSRERFFAMVNHELRNSLAAVYGWAEILVRKKEKEQVPRGAYDILEAAEQAVALLSDLLDLNRLDEDRLQPKIQSVDAGVLIRGSIHRVTPLARANNVSFEVPILKEPVVLSTDSHRVEQILVNVLTNAIRYSPPQTTVKLEIATTGSFAEIRIIDAGPGVPAEQLDRIFDIYFTASDGDRPPGQGLGLALSRRLARLLGGDLAAVAPTNGGGEFILSLPLAPA